MFREYPYLNLTDLNLDYIYRQIARMDNTLKEYVQQSTITFHDPITWDITDQYTTLTCVIDSDGTAYLSKQPVPAGIDITNTNYWMPIFNYDENITKIVRSISVKASSTGVIPESRSTGELVWLNNTLYVLDSDLPSGSVLQPNTNCHVITLEDWITAITNGLTNAIADARSDLGGDISDLNDDFLALQNNVNNFISTAAWATPQEYGAVGDGVTDDTQAFISLFADNKFIAIPEGQYLITQQLTLQSDMYIKGKGEILDHVPPTLSSPLYGALHGDTVSNVTIDGLTIQGVGASDGSYTYGCEIKFKDSSNVRVINCTVREVRKTYAICFEHCNYVWAEHNHLNRYTRSGIGCINMCNYVHINNNTLIDVTGKVSASSYPIMLNGYDYEITSPVSVGHDIECCGNLIRNSYPWWEGIDAHGCRRCVIANNAIQNCYVGIAIAGDANYQALDVTISGNILTGPGTTGDARDVSNAAIAVSHCNVCTVTGNTMRGFGKLTTSATKTTVYITDCRHLIINGNIIYGNGKEAASGNMIIYCSDSNDIAIKNNDVTNNLAVRWLYIRGNSNNFMVSGNRVYGSGNAQVGSTASAPHKIVIVDNDIDDPSQSVYTYIMPDRAPRAQISNIKAGTLGHVIYASNPVSGQPYGWICTTAQTANDAAVYTSLGSLA